MTVNFKETPWMAIRFAKNVPECEREYFKTKTEAKKWAMENMDISQEPWFIFEYHGQVKISYEENYP